MQPPSHPTIADVVSRARLKLGMNQVAFGRIVGKSEGVMSRYENGVVEPPCEVTMHCMSILNGGNGNLRPTGSLDELITTLEATLDLVRSLRDRSAGLAPRDPDSDNSHQPRQA